MLVDSFKVIAATTDITDMVSGMSFFESINGMVKGNIQMLDGRNFFDEVIAWHDRLIPIALELTYLNETILMTFMIDGINQMKIFKSEKQYVMHLISEEEFSLKLSDINAVFNGTANDVMEGIFIAGTGKDSRLIVNTLSTTKGKYIVPHIPAIDAIANVAYVAVDDENTGFYFYQRFWDQGNCRFASLYSMSIDFHTLGGNKFKISNKNITLKTLEEGHDKKQGDASIFELEEYRMHHSDKLRRGEYGNVLHHVELDKTNIKKHPRMANTSGAIASRHKISEFIYGRPITIPPGPHSDEEPETYEQKSLFHDVDSPTTQAAINLRKRIYNNTINVSGMSPSPYLGAGKSIELELGSSDIASNISDGPYIVSNVNHIFTRSDDGGGLDYVQNVELLREYA